MITELRDFAAIDQNAITSKPEKSIRVAILVRNVDFETAYCRCYAVNDSYVAELLGFPDIAGGFAAARVFLGCFAVSAEFVAETFLVGTGLEGAGLTAGLGRGAATSVGLLSTAGLSDVFGAVTALGLAACFVTGLVTALGFTLSGAVSATLGMAATTVFRGAIGSFAATGLAAALGLAGTLGSTFALATTTGLAFGAAIGFAAAFGFAETLGLAAEVFASDLRAFCGALTAPEVLACNAR